MQCNAARKAHNATQLQTITGKLHKKIKQIKASRKEAAQEQWELQEQLNHANSKESKKGWNMSLQLHFSEADLSSSSRVKSAPLIKKPADPVISTESEIKGAGDGFMHSAWEMLTDGSIHNMHMAHADSSISDEQHNAPIFPAITAKVTTETLFNGPFTAMLNSDFMPYGGDLPGYEFSDFTFDFGPTNSHTVDPFGALVPASPVPFQDFDIDVANMLSLVSLPMHSFTLPLLLAPPTLSTDESPSPRSPSTIILKKRQQDEVDAQDILPEGLK